jgi:site-specific recombinase XerD
MEAEKRRIHALSHPHANDPDWVNREMRRWNRRAGLGEGDVTPHMLRHSAATNLCRSGLPIHIVRDLMNHSSMAVTQRYVKVGTDAVAEWRARARTLRLLDGIDLSNYRRQ